MKRVLLESKDEDVIDVHSFARVALIAGVLLLANSAAIGAQDTGVDASPDAAAAALPGTSADSSDSLRTRAVRHWQLMISGARNSAFRTRAGMRDRDVLTVALRTAVIARAGNELSVGYTVTVVPLTVSTRTPRAKRVRPCHPPSGLVPCTFLEYGTIVGAGVLPLGLQLVAFPDSRISLTTSGAAGFVAFTRPVPDPDARRLNFLGEATAGFEFRLSDKRRLSIGYRREHVSNAGTAEANPGLDARMLFVGVNWRHRP